MHWHDLYLYLYLFCSLHFISVPKLSIGMENPAGDMQELSVWCVNSDFDTSSTSATSQDYIIAHMFIIGLMQRIVNDGFVKTEIF